eukprot:gene9579-11345_t
MVHNGIEYADMQFIAEAYDFMRHIYGMGNIEIAAVFSNWNKGRLRSYLFEITSEILIKEDDQQSGNFLLDAILDQSGQKGTGKWTVQEAANIGMAVPSISAALEARFTSARKAERVMCDKVYSRVVPPISVRGHVGATAKKAGLEALEEALYASKILAYAQGFTMIKAASDEFKWNICLSDLALIWRGGCIIRANLLNGISAAFKQVPDSPSLLFDSSFAEELFTAQKGLRQVVLEAVGEGIGRDFSSTNPLAVIFIVIDEVFEADRISSYRSRPYSSFGLEYEFTFRKFAGDVPLWRIGRNFSSTRPLAVTFLVVYGVFKADISSYRI